MDKRTKILGSLFALVLGYVFFSRMIYPKLEYYLHLDDEIAQLEQRHESLEFEQQRVERAAKEYRDFAARTGSVDAFEAKNRLTQDLQKLVDRCKLRETTVSISRPGSPDRKTGLLELKGTIKGDGDLQAATQFLEQVAGLPQIVRVTTASISPTGGVRGAGDKLVTLSANISALVLPEQEKILVEKLSKGFESGEIVQPETHERVASLRYSDIWQAEPFWEYAPPKVPVRQTPVVQKNDDTPAPPPPPVKVDHRWKDRNKLRLVWAGTYGSSDVQRAACILAVEGPRGADDTRRVTLGEDFDGGTLLYVHQSGVLVGREDGHFVYALGKKLDEETDIDEAREAFPVLARAFEKLAVEHHSDEAASRKHDRSRSDRPEDQRDMTNEDTANAVLSAFLGMEGEGVKGEKAAPDREEPAMKQPVREVPAEKVDTDRPVRKRSVPTGRTKGADAKEPPERNVQKEPVRPSGSVKRPTSERQSRGKKTGND